MGKEKTKVTYRYTVKVLRANIEFRPGMGVGVLATQEATFNATDKQKLTPLFQLAVLDFGKEMLDDIIEIEIEELK